MPKSGQYNEQYPVLLEHENKIKLLEPFNGAKNQHSMQCLVCEHVWTATPISKRQTYKKRRRSGCPNCLNLEKQQTYASIRNSRLQQLEDRGILIHDEEYDGRLRLDRTGRLKDEKITVTNTNCGHAFDTTPLNLIQSNITCNICAVDQRVDILTKSSKARSEVWRETASEWETYKAGVTALTRNTYTIHEQLINPNNHSRGKAGQDGAYHLDHIVPIRFCFEHNIPADICADKTNLQVIDWRSNVGSRDNLKDDIPAVIRPYIDQQTLISCTVTQLQRVCNRTALNKYIGGVFTDVFLPSKQHAIKFIRTDIPNDDDAKTALNAVNQYNKAGIKHTIVFGDELYMFGKVFQKLAYYTGINAPAERIHARKCTIQEISSAEKTRFLERNHIQGSDKATVKYGAFFENHLVAVMTFTPPRLALGHRTKNNITGKWELSRFAVDAAVRVPGIASKMLRHFTRHHEWSEIFSYADRRWSVGNLYIMLGFTHEHISKPDYFYVVDGVRKHRWNYRKDQLPRKLEYFDQTLTEYQNMVNNGYYRVWDAGNIKFVLDHI